MKKLFFIMLITVLIGFPAEKIRGQYFDFDNGVPSNWNVTGGGNLLTSSLRTKVGNNSLLWNYSSGSSLIVSNPDGMLEALLTYRGGVQFWIYNETPASGKMRVEFRKGNEVVYYFDYGLEFSGWRACWVRFTEDMAGTKHRNDLDNMRFNAPSGSGRLFIDRMIFPATRINDRLTPDKQLPYINPGMNENHWGALWYWFDNYDYVIEPESHVSEGEMADLAFMDEKVHDYSMGPGVSLTALSNAKNAFINMNISEDNGIISGRSFVSNDEFNSSLNDVRMATLDPILRDLSRGYVQHGDPEAAEMFVWLVRYLIDQGMDVGSGMGTNHHYGYNFRNYAPAFFLMRDVLKDVGFFDEALAMIQYWTGLQECRIPGDVNDMQGVMDSWNTKNMGRIISIAMMDATPLKVREYKSFSEWMSQTLRFSDGTLGGIKTDGAGFHHGGLYPSYANGGFAGLGQAIEILAGTQFVPTNTALSNLEKALMATRIYANKYDWGFGISGRHPLFGTLSAGAINAFAQVALAGDPLSDMEVNPRLAAAYLRLQSSANAYSDLFYGLGIHDEEEPEGFFAYNYGALGIYRTNEIMVSIKGFNNYVWSSEIYSADNRYGRYQSYGTIQIINNSGSFKGASANGFVESGWDWNRYPGATMIHLPLEKLDSPLSGTLMVRSDETFAGAGSFKEKYGLFGMKLLETEARGYFTPDHSALKSVFIFEDRIIALGSNVFNSNAEYPTETVLFQNSLLFPSQPVFVNSLAENRAFPLSAQFQDETIWLADRLENIYVIPEGQSVEVAKQVQVSRHNKTKAETSGNFHSAWIKHGTSPMDGAYEYCIFLNSSVNSAPDLAHSFSSPQTRPYTVLRKDNVAHVVADRATSIVGAAVWEVNSDVNAGLLIQVSAPSLLMYQEIDETLTLSVTVPDLKIGGTDYELSSPSQPTMVEVFLNGSWALADGEVMDVSLQGANTRVVVACSEGQATEIKLMKVNTSLEEVGQPNVTVFPNPANDVLYVESTEEGRVSYNIYTVCGKGVINGKQALNRYSPIDIASLSRGYYLLRVNGPKNCFARFFKM